MSSVQSFDPQSMPQPLLHSYLVASVAPRPIAFASTIDSAGNVNLSPFSFFNVFSSNPPIMVFSPARRGRDHTNKHTFENIKQVPETVINLVNFAIVEQMSLASTEYERGVNEFVKAGFTQVGSQKVGPPRVGEAPVAFECRVDKVIELGQGGGAGNLVISRVVMVHIKKEYLDDTGELDTTRLDLVGRMGGSWYCRASGKALFEIPKPLRTMGIGVDQLPEAIRNSKVLTGNNLGRLANVQQLPDAGAVERLKQDLEIKRLMEQFHHSPSEMELALHRLARQYLEEGATEKALMILLLTESS